MVAFGDRLTRLFERLSSVASFDPGWAAQGPFARDVLAMQIDLFALATRLDERLAAAGADPDGAGGWSVPSDASLAALAAARNLVVPFQVGVLPYLFAAPSADGARAVFVSGPGCDLADALAAAIDAMIGGG